jgi:hypothetical protein
LANRQDTFNRADGAPSASPSDGGSSWVTLGSGGTYGVISNCGYKSAGASSRQVYYLECSSTQGTITAALGIGVSNGSNPGFCGRIVDNSNYIICNVSSGGSSSTIQMYKVVAGAFTAFGSSYAATYASTDTWTVDVNASHVWVVKQNGTTRITTSAESQHSSATKWGFVFYEPGTGYGINQWDFTDTAAAASTSFPLRRRTSQQHLLVR